MHNNKQETVEQAFHGPLGHPVDNTVEQAFHGPLGEPVENTLEQASDGPLGDALENDVSRAISRLNYWLETMRTPQGYGGPISHWWDSCLVYAGAMLDWRYEGIVCGYLNLYRTTGESAWLDKAVRAADDLCRGQWPDGHFWNSSFEFGPAICGTPHEAAVDVALLEVASTLREEGAPEWETYLAAAQRHVEEVLIARLWNGHGFKEQPHHNWLVANKNATTLEALLLYQRLTNVPMQRYIKGAAQVVLNAQVLDGIRAGGTIHIGTHQHQLTIGIYTARCVSTLARLMTSQPRVEYERFLARAVYYLGRLIDSESTLFGHYRNGQPIAAPQWISPSGDLLRALLLARKYVDVPEEWITRLIEILLNAQHPTGAIPTAKGFAQLGSQRGATTARPDFRDVLPVTGWCDKAFYALTLLPESASSRVDARGMPTELRCQWQGRKCRYYEYDSEISLFDFDKNQMLYFWHKGDSYPTCMNLWL